jgi:hypothetical protein
VRDHPVRKDYRAVLAELFPEAMPARLKLM